MSRSYGKSYPRGKPYKPVSYKRFRAACRAYTRKETASREFEGEAYPLPREFLKGSGGRNYIYKSEIRKEICLDIRHALNGHCDRKGVWDECFIDAFNEIKGAAAGSGSFPLFRWLEYKKVKAVVRTWTGNPFDLLRHLTRNGYIERAVSREFKMRAAK